MRRFQVVMIVALAALLAGCAGSGPGAGGGQRGGVFTNIMEIWPREYEANLNQIKTFYGKARLSVDSEAFSGDVSMEVNWINPEKLHLKAEGPLGIDIGKIYIGTRRFLVYDQHNNYYTSGDIDDPYLNRFQNTSFTLKDLKFAALGYALPVDKNPQLQDQLHGIFIHQDDDIQYRYLVNPQTGLLESCEAIRDGRIFMQQEFKNYRVVSGVYVPNFIQITLLDQKERISIFYQQIVINEPIAPLKFDVEISSKVEQINLD